jgi:hypothetical protein
MTVMLCGQPVYLGSKKTMSWRSFTITSNLPEPATTVSVSKHGLMHQKKAPIILASMRVVPMETTLVSEFLAVYLDTRCVPAVTLWTEPPAKYSSQSDTPRTRLCHKMIPSILSGVAVTVTCLEAELGTCSLWFADLEQTH